MSNFKCSECGMVNIDCGKGVFKTPRELELETLVIELENRLKTLDEEAVTYQLTEKEYEEYKKLKVSCERLEEENEELNKKNNFLLQRLEVDDTETSLVFKLQRELENSKSEFYHAVVTNVKLKNHNQQLDGAITKLKCYEQALDEIKSMCDRTCQVCQIFTKCDKKIKERIKKLVQDDMTETECSEYKSLKTECDKLEKENKVLRKLVSELEYSVQVGVELNDRYCKAFEEIENVSKKGLNSICYKSNCSRCQCYDSDDCNAGMNSLVNNYFTENGEFADENGDFIEALEALIESERKKCNKAIPITQQVLDIISKVKGE